MTAKGIEEEVADPRSHALGHAAPPAPRALQRREWEEIERVSPLQRRLGAVMIDFCQRLVDGKQGQDGEATLSSSLAFSDKLWSCMWTLLVPQHLPLLAVCAPRDAPTPPPLLLQGKGKPPKNSSKGASRSEAFRTSLLHAQAQRQVEICLRSLRDRHPPPRVELCLVTHLFALICLTESLVKQEMASMKKGEGDSLQEERAREVTQWLVQTQTWVSASSPVPRHAQDVLQGHLLRSWERRSNTFLTGWGTTNSLPAQQLPRLWRIFLGTPARLPATSQAHGQMALYGDQETFAKAVLQGLEDTPTAEDDGTHEAASPTVVCYRTPPSGGKTTAAALLARLLFELERRQETTKVEGTGRKAHRCRLIYACYSNSVRVDVAQMMMAVNVPFAMVTNGVVCPSFACYHGRPKHRPTYEGPSTAGDHLTFGFAKILPQCDLWPIAYVCDLVSAKLVLQMEANRHVLMLDEPTAAFTPALQEAQMAVLGERARVVALVSATLPSISSMPAVHALLRPRSVVDIVLARSMASCWASFGPEKHPCPPHRVACPSELVAHPQPAQWLAFYGPEALLQLASDEPLAWEKVIDRHDLLSWTTEACQQLAWRVLWEAAREMPQRIVNAWPAETTAMSIDIGEGLTRRAATQYGGSTLWMIEDETREWLDNVSCALLESKGAVYLLKEAEERWRRQVEQVLRETRVQGGHVGRRSGGVTQTSGENEKPRVKSRETRVEKDQRPQEERPLPELWESWDPRFVVNSREHALRFGRAGLRHRPMMTPRIPDDVAHGSQAHLVALLLSGVGSLDEADDLQYTQYVQSAARQQKLSALMLPRHLLFGLNYPVDRVVLLPQTSIIGAAELRQAAGRAGRTGHSTGEVVFASIDQARLVFLSVLDGATCTLEAMAERTLNRVV